MAGLRQMLEKVLSLGWSRIFPRRKRWVNLSESSIKEKRGKKGETRWWGHLEQPVMDGQGERACTLSKVLSVSAGGQSGCNAAVRMQVENRPGNIANHVLERAQLLAIFLPGGRYRYERAWGVAEKKRKLALYLDPTTSQCSSPYLLLSIHSPCSLFFSFCGCCLYNWDLPT